MPVQDLADDPHAVVVGADVALVDAHPVVGVLAGELLGVIVPAATVMPRFVSRLQIASPMPRIPPVTRATCPVMSAMVFTSMWLPG